MDKKINFIDEFLATCEDWMHGKEGKDVTKCRKYLSEIESELKKLRVADVSVSVCDCGNFSVEAYSPCCSLSCWHEKFEAQNEH